MSSSLDLHNIPLAELLTSDNAPTNASKKRVNRMRTKTRFSFPRILGLTGVAAVAATTVIGISAFGKRAPSGNSWLDGAASRVGQSWKEAYEKGQKWVDDRREIARRSAWKRNIATMRELAQQGDLIGAAECLAALQKNGISLDTLIMYGIAEDNDRIICEAVARAAFVRAQSLVTPTHTGDMESTLCAQGLRKHLQALQKMEKRTIQVDMNHLATGLQTAEWSAEHQQDLATSCNDFIGAAPETGMPYTPQEFNRTLEEIYAEIGADSSEPLAPHIRHALIDHAGNMRCRSEGIDPAQEAPGKILPRKIEWANSHMKGMRDEDSRKFQYFQRFVKQCQAIFVQNMGEEYVSKQ